MATDDFFRARLDGMVDMRHPLAVLASRMPWPQIEAALAPAFAHKDRKGRTVEDADMFGPTLLVAGAGVSAAGRPRLPIRLMVSLLYLKHAFNESDESVVQRWSENVVWQFFSGMEYYSPKLPCDAAQISRFRKILGEAGVEQTSGDHHRGGRGHEGGEEVRVRAGDRGHDRAREGHRPSH
jgi:IS5 family transposase